MKYIGTAPLTIWVPGLPAPQGSKKAFTRRGEDGRTSVTLVESSNAVKPWREACAGALIGTWPNWATSERG